MLIIRSVMKTPDGKGNFEAYACSTNILTRRGEFIDPLE